jgi:hypothetical protein
LEGEIAEKVVISDDQALVLTTEGHLQLFDLNDTSTVVLGVFFEDRAIMAAFSGCGHFLVKAADTWWGFGDRDALGSIVEPGEEPEDAIISFSDPVRVAISGDAVLPQMGFEVSRLVKAARKR